LPSAFRGALALSSGFWRTTIAFGGAYLANGVERTDWIGRETGSSITARESTGESDSEASQSSRRPFIDLRQAMGLVCQLQKQLGVIRSW
jgi:hypothetical protein